MKGQRTMSAPTISTPPASTNPTNVTLSTPDLNEIVRQGAEASGVPAEVLLSSFAAAIRQFKNPTPEQPPGTDGILTVLNWISWIVIVAGMAGFLISAGTLAFAAFTGREVNSFKGMETMVFGRY